MVQIVFKTSVQQTKKKWKALLLFIFFWKHFKPRINYKLTEI